MTAMELARWHPVSKALHWLMAGLIGWQLWLGWTAEDLPFSPRKLELFITHKSIGLVLLMLVLVRLAWRMRTGVPAPADQGSALEHRLASLGHGLLYVLMFAVPLSGWWISDTSRIPFKLFGIVPAPDFLATDKGSSELAASVHEALVIALVVLIVVHVLAALRHHFLLGNATLRRMLPFLSPDR